MKKFYFCILMLFCTFVYLLAVPGNGNIKMTPTGDHCFSSTNEATVTWDKSFKEPFFALWPWPTTWSAINGLAPAGSFITVSGLEVQPTIDATSGSCVLNFPKPGMYVVTVKIRYQADRTTLPLYPDQVFTKTFNINFYKVTKFEPRKEKKVVKMGSTLTKEDFTIEVEPSAGYDIVEWSKDNSDSAGHHKAYLKLEGKTCAETEFISVSVEFNVESIYAKADINPNEKLFNAKVIPADARDYINFFHPPFDSFDIIAQDLGNGKFDFDVQVYNGNAKTSLKAKIIASNEECDSIDITCIDLIEPLAFDIVNGESKDIVFKTVPANVGVITQMLNSSKLNVGTLSNSNTKFVSKGDPGVFQDIQNRKENTSKLTGTVFVQVGSQTLNWNNINIGATVKNAPPNYIERLVPNEVPFNTTTFETTGWVIYKDIDDLGEHYRFTTGNTKNDGADFDATTGAESVSKEDIDDKKIKFTIKFKTTEGIKIFRKIFEFNFTLTAGLGEYFGVEGQVAFRFEVPLSEIKRFTKDLIIVQMTINLPATTVFPDSLKEKIGNFAASLTGVEPQTVVKFTPNCSFDSGGNNILIDGGDKGLPFESVNKEGQKIKISVGGSWVKTY